MKADPIFCPRCGRQILILVGQLGPCEPCMGELRAEREQMRETLSGPHPCEACGAELTGRRRYCGATCRSIAWRRRQGAVA